MVARTAQWTRWAMVLIATCLVAPAYAGMPTLTLTDLARARVEVISFFLLLFLLAAFIVKLLWNGLRKDFTRLPRLTYARSLAIVSLWGLLFVLILTMISGARELMTPGAWEKNGLTYRIKSDSHSAADDALTQQIESQRPQKLSELKGALWAYAAQHDGNLPPDDHVSEIPAPCWETPEVSRIHYVYVGGARAGVGDAIVAYEPAVFATSPLVLTSDGQIRAMSEAQIKEAIKKETQ